MQAFCTLFLFPKQRKRKKPTPYPTELKLDTQKISEGAKAVNEEVVFRPLLLALPEDFLQNNNLFFHIPLQATIDTRNSALMLNTVQRIATHSLPFLHCFQGNVSDLDIRITHFQLSYSSFFIHERNEVILFIGTM